MIWNFFGIFVISGISFWLINNCFGLLKIIKIVENFRNCGKIPNLLICEFLRICWNIFENFIVENLLFSNIGNY